MNKTPIKSHKDLRVYQMAFEAAMQIFESSKKFPPEEKYSMTDPSGSQSLMGQRACTKALASRRPHVTPKAALSHQIRRSSRSVCANLAEAWRKGRYKAAFLAKLSDSETEAAETQTWIEFAVKCNYMNVEIGRKLYGIYNQILGNIVNMINNPTP